MLLLYSFKVMIMVKQIMITIMTDSQYNTEFLIRFYSSLKESC